jgi:hypothetical protein
MVNAPSGGEVCVWICSPEKIDWNVVRAETLDCLNAVFELQTWAERSQQEDYDIDSATLHLAVIEKAFETSLRSLRMLFMGMDFDSSVPLRQFPIFDQLALASTGDSGRPDFEIAATAHEAAFTLLMLTLIHIKKNLEDDLTINDLQGFSPKKRRDTLCQLEKRAPLMNLLGGSARLCNLKAWINREWAAVSAIQRQTGSKANPARGFDMESIAALARCLQTIVGKAMADREIEPELRLVVDDGENPQATLDGKAISISKKQADLLRLLIEARGEYVSLAGLGLRSRDVEGLPDPIRKFVETQPGVGTRIPSDKLFSKKNA